MKNDGRKSPCPAQYFIFSKYRITIYVSSLTMCFFDISIAAIKYYQFYLAAVQVEGKKYVFHAKSTKIFVWINPEVVERFNGSQDTNGRRERTLRQWNGVYTGIPHRMKDRLWGGMWEVCISWGCQFFNPRTSEWSIGHRYEVGYMRNFEGIDAKRRGNARQTANEKTGESERRQRYWHRHDAHFFQPRSNKHEPLIKAHERGRVGLQGNLFRAIFRIASFSEQSAKITVSPDS